MKHLKTLPLSLIALSLFTPALQAAEVTATETLRRGITLSENDISITLSEGENKQDIKDDYIGKVVKRTLYKGSNISSRDVSNPVVIKRNSVVTLRYRLNGIEITTTGRALTQASEGEAVTVINSSSRNRVEGTATSSGIVEMVR